MILLLILSAAGVGLLAGLWLSRARRRWRLRRLANRGRAAEHAAAQLLTEQGFSVVGQQLPGGYEYWVDGELQQAEVRVDFLAERHGRQYLVEVKSGKSADPRQRNTRRQLLEYAHAYEVDGLILANMEQRQLELVEFFRRTEARWLTPALLALVAALLVLWSLGARW